MDSIFKIPASPGTPLFPVSPERVNRQHFQQLPHSPSLPFDLSSSQQDPFISHSRGSSDVQGKVAQFNNLSRDAAQRRKDNEAALKRAVVGREEAESETRRLREDNKVLRKEMEEGRGRERRVGERLESIIEEMQRAKETHAHSQALYEKEIRRARKEAFKSSSALVKLQEELKTTRNRLTLMREEVEMQKRRVETREQETFAAQYQLVGVQEELESAKHQIRVIEEERDSLKTSLKEEEVARIAAEGRIALPASKEGDEFSSPKKKRSAATRRDSVKENVDPDIFVEEEEDELTLLKRELRIEKKIRAKALDQIDFMKLECQFRCCSCRIAESQGIEYIHDGSLAAAMAEKAAEIAEAYEQLGRSAPKLGLDIPTHKQQAEDLADGEPLIEFSPTSGTFRTLPSPASPQSAEPLRQDPPVQEHTAPPSPQPTISSPLLPTALPESPPLFSLSAPPTTPPPPTPATIALATTPPLSPSPPLRRPHTTRIISTTTTVPLQPFSPFGTVSREDALEQIRQRRGRARSIAMGNGTPRKGMHILDLDALKRRDVSAPTGRV